MTKGIILAGGTGSRLGLNCEVINKHLLPVYTKPMILWPLETLTKMGITDVMITVGGNSVGEIMDLVKDGSEFGCNVTYKYQKGANGIADAVRITKDFAAGDDICVILGDNVFLDNNNELLKIKKYYDDHLELGAMCVLKEVSDPERFGVAEISNNRIISIVEKPQKPRSNYAITGLYFLGSDAFQVIKNLKPSNRGEYEITDVLIYYMSINKLGYEVFKNSWTDAGTYDSLLKANILAKEYIDAQTFN